MFSDIKVWPLKNKHPKVLANGMFTMSETFRIKFTLFKSSKGLFVGFPGKYADKIDPETGKKQFYPDVKILDDNIRNQLTELIVTEYNRETGNTALNQGDAPGPTNQESNNIPF